MASGSDRTEKATPKRRGEARQKGQVARSPELSTSAVLAGGLIGVVAFGPKVATTVADAMESCWAQIADGAAVTSAAGLHNLESIVLHALLVTVAPIAGMCLAIALLTNVAQVGIKPHTQALRPQFSKLNPVQGAKRIWGSRAGFELGKTLAKVLVVGGITAMSIVPMIRHLSAGVGTAPMTLGSLMVSSAKSIVMRVLAIYVLISLADYLWQRRTLEKSLKMSKQEVKDESRNTDLPPEVRAALRRRRMQLVRQRMMAAVPNADVVVTNPTHYAVALKYDGSKPAPIVVAKGKNLIAAQIRRIATENGVPIVPDPPLARSLHASVELDQMIPAELYAAVAQILAYVYRLAGRRITARQAAA